MGDDWQPIVPVPRNAPLPPEEHYRWGTSTSEWLYRDRHGRLLFLIRRYDPAKGKVFLPLSFCENTAGERHWRWKALPEPRPLYKLEEIAERHSVSVIVCEGERSAEAAGRLLPDYVTTTSSNGSRSSAKSDWSPLYGRRVLIWPDADQVGSLYAGDVARHAYEAGAQTVHVFKLPDNLPAGFDAADAETERWSNDSIQQMIETARLAEAHTVADDPSQKPGETCATTAKKRTRQRDQLFDLIDDRFQFWHDSLRAKYVTYPVGNHHEHTLVRSDVFKDHLAGLFYENNKTPLGDSALSDAVRVMHAWAMAGKEYETYVRIAGIGENVFIDLADREWRCVCIDRDGWSVGTHSEVKFLRPASSRSMPEPARDGSIENMRAFCGNMRDADFMLVSAWLLGALRPDGPYPVLAVSGEQGSGKSSLTDFLANLIDPEVGKRRPASREERDLIISAKNSHALLYDNLSGIAAWFSDALCRLSTGGGFQTRKLHSDDEQLVLQAQRPVICNGIPDLTSRADLADRAISIDLPRIEPDQRQTERAIRQNTTTETPKILGALFDAVSAGIRNFDTVEVQNPPRMADFCQWVIACLPALNWDSAEFLEAYRENRSGANRAAFESDPIAQEIVRVVREQRPTGFTGVSTQLLALLNDFASPASINLRVWPKTPAALGQQLKRCSPLLRSEGFDVSHFRNSKGRFVTIKPSL